MQELKSVRECVVPRRLFGGEPSPFTTQSPTRSEPEGRRRRPKKEERTLVKTAQGRSVLTSDIRLHLEKVKAQQNPREQRRMSSTEMDDELARLDKERRILEAKVRQRKTIHRLQEELDRVSEGRVSSEYQTNEHESSWRQSGDNHHRGEDSSASFNSRRRRRPSSSDEESEGGESQRSSRSRPSDITKLQDDVALCKDFIRTHSGGLEVPHESPLSDDIENSKIDRRLKVLQNRQAPEGSSN